MTLSQITSEVKQERAAPALLEEFSRMRMSNFDKEILDLIALTENSEMDASTPSLIQLRGILRVVREKQRYDLVYLCDVLYAEFGKEDIGVAEELILLFTEAGNFSELMAFLKRNTMKSYSLSGDVLLKFLTKTLPHDTNPLEIWPDERLGDAAKTAVLNVGAAVALRQRALLEVLLKTIDQAHIG